MAGLRGEQPAERLARALHARGRVTEHVDRARAEVRRADALGHDEHARAGLGEPHGRGQPREPGADHDHVVMAHAGTSPFSTGRCSTSSSPWKIQSSSRAWRSWSP